MTDNSSFKTLEKLHRNMSAFVSDKITFPEPTLKLDIENRKNEPSRIFKYIHQQCTLHTEGFVRAQQIKTTYIVSGYIEQIKQENPIGTYLFCRTMLELTAFMHEVLSRLSDIVDKEEKLWEEKGRQFFATIARARYSTSDNNKETLLKESDLANKHIKPINIMNCLQKLSKNKKYGELANKYDELCDYVHHNLSSQLACSQGIVITDTIKTVSGGAIKTLQEGPATVYEYPTSVKAKEAKDNTLEFMLKNGMAIIEMTNQLPRTPYTEKELISRIGNRYGMLIEKIPHTDNFLYDLTRKKTIEPYDLCFCGSLKKHKFCCKSKIKKLPNQALLRTR